MQLKLFYWALQVLNNATWSLQLSCEWACLIVMYELIFSSFMLKSGLSSICTLMDITIQLHGYHYVCGFCVFDQHCIVVFYKH